MAVFDFFGNEVSVVKANLKDETVTVITKSGERLVQPFNLLVSEDGLSGILDEAMDNEGVIK